MLARLTCHESVCDICYYASVKSKEFQCYPYYWLRWSTYCTESYDLHAWLMVEGAILLGFVVMIAVTDLILLALYVIRNKVRHGYNII